jgi:Tol biopolymer transport system component
MNGQVVRKTALGLGVCDPAWSPDGTRLAVTTAEGLWVISNVFVDKGDSGERLVDSQAAPGAKAEFAYVAFSKPSWSPDGSRLAFVATSGGGSWVEVVDAASGQRLAKSAVGPSDFRWATDSRSLTVGGTTLRVP